MSDKLQIIQKVKESGLVAIVRCESAEKAARIADACAEGGVAAIEITFTVPGAHRVIEELAKRYPSGGIILGAGTVIDSETARTAILSGAKYIVTPCFNADVIKLCNRYAVPCMPGAMTVREIVDCMEAGADIIKIFPGELLGPRFIKAVLGPLPQAQMMPTGGVNIDNVGDWIKAGAVAVGVGGNLTAGAQKDDYASITAAARQFIRKISEARTS